jgi:hypothetical protein
MTTEHVVARDTALDDEAALHRSLRIVRVFLEVYGEDPATYQLLTELTEHLIGVRRNARARHQEAEAARLAYVANSIKSR